jgi:hypothetical protein
MMGLGEHHVVAARVARDGFLGGSFAWVTQYPLCDDLAYMKAALETNGWTPESCVTVLADGADGLNNLICSATEKATRKRASENKTEPSLSISGQQRTQSKSVAAALFQ